MVIGILKKLMSWEWGCITTWIHLGKKWKASLCSIGKREKSMELITETLNAEI